MGTAPEVIRCGHERRPRLRREPRCLYRVVGLSELHVFRSSMFLEVRVLVCLKARFVFKPKPELPFRPVGPSVGEVVRSTPLRAPGLVLAAHGVGWRALRVLPRLVFWPHCVY